MINDIWINLPVSNIEASRKFYTSIGFTLNEKHQSPDSLSFLIGGKKVVLMLFKTEMFERFTQQKSSDTTRGSEVLFSIGAASREDIDRLAEKAIEGGGSVFGKPTEIQGWMYGCGIADPDGHRWNGLFMEK